MTEMLELSAHIREKHGTGASRRMRHQGQVPAVIYGGGGEPQSLTIEHRKLIKALENEAFASSILTVDIDGNKVQAVLKSLQRHPYKPKVLHADFLRINAKEKITMRVPIHFIGEDVAPGVKLNGGIVSHLMTEVEIKCFPKDLPEFIDVDMSKLDVEQSFHLSSLVLADGVELSTPVEAGADNDLPIASIHVPRGTSADDDAAAEGADAEGKDDAGDDKKDA